MEGSFFRELVKNLALLSKAQYVFISRKSADASETHVESIAFWANGAPAENIKYALQHTPCEAVIKQGKICFYSSGIRELFPKDKDFQEMEIESYLGYPVRSSNGQILGHVSLFDTKPLENEKELIALAESFSAIASAEFERAINKELLVRQEEFSRNVLNNSLDAFIAINREGKIIEWNIQASQIFGWQENEVKSKTLEEFIIPRGQKGAHKKGLEKFLETGKSTVLNKRLELEALHKNGSLIPIELTVTPVRIGGEVVFFSAFLRDISERKHAEHILHNKNQTLEALNLCNKELLHASDESELLNAICKIIVDIGGFKVAGVGFALHDKNKSVEFIATYGDKKNYLTKAKINWRDNDKRSQGPCGVAIRTGKSCLIKDVNSEPAFKPWVNAAIQSGFSSNLAIPLEINNEVFGVLTVYSETPDDFDQEKMQLLESLANNLAYGVSSLRIKKEREQTRLKLEETEKKYSNALDVSPDAVVITRVADGKIIEVNDACMKLSGYSREELVGKTTLELNIYGQEERQRVISYLEKDGRFSDIESILTRKDGRVLNTLSSAVVLEIKGELCVFAIIHDITNRIQKERALSESEHKFRSANWLLELEKKALEQISRHTHPEKILQDLVVEIEGKYEDMLCSVSRLEGEYLYSCAASRLPEEYAKEIGKVKIGISAGSCGTAAYLNKGIFVDDISRDPKWKFYRTLANKYGLKACWSVPISGAFGKVYGTFAIYYKEVRKADSEHVSMLENIKKVAELAFDQYFSNNELTQSVERFRGTFDYAPMGMILSDVKGYVAKANSAFCEMMGYPEDEMIGKHFLDLTIPDEHEESKENYRKLISGELKSIKLEKRYIHKEGHILNIILSVSTVNDAEGNINHLVAQMDDITYQKESERKIRESENRFRELYDDTPAMFFTINQDKTIFSVNQYGAKKLGYQADELIGNSVTDIVLEDDVENYADNIAQCFLTDKKINNWQIRKYTRSGDVIWCRETARVILDSNDQKQILLVSEDITEAYHLSEQLSYQASHDALTGLTNRREFEMRLDKLIIEGAEKGISHAFCYLDLDQFKVINDTCGHLAGDELLRQLAELFRTKVRKQDTLARLGGDEFGVLMENCTLVQAQRVANTLRELVEEFQFVWADKRFSIGVSIGLVPIDDRGGDSIRILSAADAACYAAKDAGRNRVHIYHDKDIQLANQRGEMQWVSKINHALEDNLLRLYMQPIVPLADEEDGSKHYECLIRMKDDDGATILPGAFLPAAERYDLSTKLDRWVFDNVYQWMSKRRGEDKNLISCSINLSAHSLSNEAFLQHIIETVEHGKVSPGNICFEITETTAISRLSNAIKFMETLKSKGCFFALDDFGSGVSSFGYLKNLPVDFLKIDGMFVRDMQTDPIDFEMVRSINEIGHVMGKKTIAEFVENEEILESLKKLGVDYAQGYYIGKPKAIRIPVVKDKKAKTVSKKTKVKKEERKARTRKTDKLSE